MWKPPRATLLTVSSALLVLAPKCPVCFLAYFGIFGVATASASVYRAWLPTVTAIWLALTIAVLGFRAGRQRRYGPFAVAVTAGLAVFAGKFIVPNQVMSYAGMVALMVAAVWGSWSQTSADTESCSQCEPNRA